MSSSPPVAYRDWSLTYGKPRGAVYDEAEARRRWSAGQRFCVLVGAPDRPSQVAIVDLGGTVVEVVWLDALLRPELTYVFAVRTDAPGWPTDRMLLEQVRLATYADDTPMPEAQSSYDEFYAFHPDGTVYGERGSRDGSDAEKTESRLGDAELVAQYEPVPAFGDWASVLRRER